MANISEAVAELIGEEAALALKDAGYIVIPASELAKLRGLAQDLLDLTSRTKKTRQP